MSQANLVSGSEYGREKKRIEVEQIYELGIAHVLTSEK
jgi:hypothetical protein